MLWDCLNEVLGTLRGWIREGSMQNTGLEVGLEGRDGEAGNIPKRKKSSQNEEVANNTIS